jgi:predicted GNAT family N-acyltransferase
MADLLLDHADAQARDLIIPEMHRYWGRGMSLDTYKDYLKEVDGHPWARRQIRPLVLRDRNQQPLASLYLHAVRGLHNDKEIWLGGIARVLTPEALRGKGHARELMRRILELLDKESVDGAYLFSDIDPRFYEQFGFVTIGKSVVQTSITVLPQEAGAEKARPIQTEEDWEPVHRIHTSMGKGEPLWLLREPEHWDYLLSRSLIRARHRSDDAPVPLDVVLISDTEVIGYAIARIQGDELDLSEFGMLEPDRAKLRSLFGALRGEAEARGCSRFRSPWPPGKWGKLYDGWLTPSERTEGIFMFLPLRTQIDLGAIRAASSGSWHTDHI